MSPEDALTNSNTIRDGIFRAIVDRLIDLMGDHGRHSIAQL